MRRPTLTPSARRVDDPASPRAGTADQPRRRPAVLVTVLLLSALVLAACGGGSADGASEEEVLAASEELITRLDAQLAESEERLLLSAEAAAAQAADGQLGTLTPGTLTVGTNADFPPFVSVEEGRLVGFDIELFDAIATRMGLVRTYEDMAFTELTGAMTAGQVDVLVAAFTVTDERDEVLDFSAPYFVASQALLVTQGSPITSIEDLDEEAELLVLTDTTGAQFAEQSLPLVPVTSVSGRQAAVSRLVGGLGDALLMDFLSAQQEAALNPDLVVVEEIPTGERYAYGIAEGNVALQLRLDEAIAGVIADGTYAEIFQRWFPDRDLAQALSILQ